MAKDRLPIIPSPIPDYLLRKILRGLVYRKEFGYLNYTLSEDIFTIFKNGGSDYIQR